MQSQGTHSLFSRFLIVIGFLALVALSEASFQTNIADFFSGERSWNLWITDELNRGKTLYRDVFSPYGALPTYLHAWIAALFGNTTRTFLRMQQVEALVIAWLAWVFLRRHLTRESSLLFLLTFLAPSLLFSTGRTIHVELERIMILLLALAWRPASSSTYRHLIWIGTLMGSMQMIKFGGGIVALGAWGLAETCLQNSWKDLIGRWIALVLGYMGFTFLWALFLFAWLPSPIAMDVLWPSYMTTNYSIYVDSGSRWPAFSTFKNLVAQEIQPILAIGLTAAMVASGLIRGNQLKLANQKNGAGAFLFLTFFFAVACVIYFKHVWHFYEFFWVIILASAWMWNRLPMLPRLIVALTFLLSASIDVHRLLKENPLRDQVLVMPTGDQLGGNVHEIFRIEKIKSAVDPLLSKDRNAVFVVGMGSGWHHFFNWPAANRNSGWLMAGLIRPYDEAPFIQSLDRTAAVIVYQKMASSDPRTWNICLTQTGLPIPSGLPVSICNALARRLGNPVIIDDECSVYPVLPLLNEPPSRTQTPP